MTSDVLAQPIHFHAPYKTPKASVRLSAGRQGMSDAVHALCFVAGPNSIFYGDKLLPTPNPEGNADRALFDRLGLKTGHPVARD